VASGKLGLLLVVQQGREVAVGPLDQQAQQEIGSRGVATASVATKVLSVGVMARQLLGCEGVVHTYHGCKIMNEISPRYEGVNSSGMDI